MQRLVAERPGLLLVNSGSGTFVFVPAGCQDRVLSAADIEKIVAANRYVLSTVASSTDKGRLDMVTAAPEPDSILRACTSISVLCVISVADLHQLHALLDYVIALGNNFIREHGYVVSAFLRPRSRPTTTQ